MKLDEAAEGSHLIISAIEGGRTMRRRLAEVGIFEGEEIEIVRRGMGPLIVRAAGAKMAIGRGQASKIEVRPL